MRLPGRPLFLFLLFNVPKLEFKWKFTLGSVNRKRGIIVYSCSTKIFKEQTESWINDDCETQTLLRFKHLYVYLFITLLMTCSIPGGYEGHTVYTITRTIQPTVNYRTNILTPRLHVSTRTIPLILTGTVCHNLVRTVWFLKLKR